jgi:hypothetical protein
MVASAWQLAGLKADNVLLISANCFLFRPKRAIKKGPPLVRGPGLWSSVWWLTRATQGRLLRVEEVIAIGKKDVVQRGHLEKTGIKKAPPEERGALKKLVG